MQMTLKHFSDCLFYFCSTCADSITELLVTAAFQRELPPVNSAHYNQTLISTTSIVHCESIKNIPSVIGRSLAKHSLI